VRRWTAGLLWILDVGNNTAMDRAFIADTLDEEQQPVGFQAQSFFYRFRSF
jgi:maltose/moltooligosaccharide transporter